MKWMLSLVFYFIFQQCLLAQKSAQSEWTPSYHVDTAQYAYNSGTNPTHFKRWFVPVTFVVYGVLATHLDALTDVNENLKYDIWDKHPHNTVTIDNYFQFVPAVAVYGLNIAGIHGEHNLLDRSMIYAI